jgi:protoporphyrinogen oxidase
MSELQQESRRPRRVAVIGAGPMGLGAAYELAKSGAQVTVFERDDRIGGMSAHFDFDGTRIERYYHFVCAPDETTFRYLDELGIADQLRWVETKMGYYFRGRLYDWGHPFALLTFPGLTLAQKVRYGLHLMSAKRISDWRPLDALSSTEWLHRAIGKEAYDVMWRPLFHYKFYQFENSLSAAWLGTRIKRVALSRKNLFQERLGYIEGGSEAILDALAKRIVVEGGDIELGRTVEEVVMERAGDGSMQVRGLRVDGDLRPFDAVVSTIPLPYLARLAPAMPRAELDKIAAIGHVGVVCVLLKLRRPFTRNFWMNINDPRIEIPGLIEYTNLNPLDGSAIVYAPFYMPHDHPKYRRDAREFIDETLAALCLIRPDFDPRDVLASTTARYDFAQTVCRPGFFDALPPMRSAVRGLFLADTSHYYPEDRSISESLRIGAELAGLESKERGPG